MEILNYSAVSKNLFSNSSSNSELDFSNADLLKCGSCCAEFLLSDICLFIQHKNKPCCIELNDHHYSGPSPTKNTNSLKCTSCSDTFKSAYSLLEHAQVVHKLNLFTNNDFTTPTPTTKKTNSHQQRQQQSEPLIEQPNEEEMLTPKKEIFVDVSTTASEDSAEKSANHSTKNRSTSLSLSATSPTMSTTSSSSSSQLQTSSKSPAGSECNNNVSSNISIDHSTEHSTPKHRCNSISFDFRDSHLKPQTNKNQFRRGSQVQLLDPNENSSTYSVESGNGGGQMNSQNTSFYSIQNAYSPKQIIKSGRLNLSYGDDKKKKLKQQASFYCDVCHASFNQKIHLTKHSAKHTGIKPFKCSECNYSTVERSHLKVHVRVHTGEKPFKCSFCDYATAQSSTLKIHKKRHHDKQDEPPSENNKFRENSNQQNTDDSQSNQAIEIDSESMKCESIDSKDDQYVDYSSQQQQQNIYIMNNNGSFPSKRTKTYSFNEKPKRITSLASSYQDTTSKHSLNTIFNSSEQMFNKFDRNNNNTMIENPNFKLKANKLNISFNSQQNNRGAELYPVQLTEAENKLLGLANIALEREIN